MNRPMRSRQLAAAMAVGISFGTLVALFDALWVLLVEFEQPPGYFILGGALIIGSSAGISLLLSPLPAAPAWIGSALLALGAWLAFEDLGWLAIFLPCFLVLQWSVRRGARPVLVGTACAACLCVTGIGAPRALSRVHSILPEGIDIDAALLGTLLVAGTALLVAPSTRLTTPRQARVVAGAMAAGLLLLAATPLVFGDRSAANGPSPPPIATGTPPYPHVVLIVLDTVRADHLSLYGYERPTTPGLDAYLAGRAGAAVFPRVFSNSPWTVPSHASLFTGLPPAQHGAHFTPGNQFNFGIGDHPTLAENMQDAGYFTIGLYSNPWLGRVSGLDRGFDVYAPVLLPDRLPVFGEALRRMLTPGLFPEMRDISDGSENLRLLREHLEGCGDQPCFAFTNLLDAHSHYVADECRGRFADWSPFEDSELISYRDTPERIANLKARYDEEICDLDGALTALLRSLDESGLSDHTWVFITSDHGEAFGDHGNVEHGTSAYNDQVWIPLIVVPPTGDMLRATPDPASLIDVTETILAIAEAEPIAEGRDLRNSEPEAASAQIEFYGDPVKVDDRNPRAADPARAVVRGALKLVEQSGRTELFDIREDPDETTDLASDRPEIVARVRSSLPEFGESDGSVVESEPIPPHVLKQLRELGYVE